MAAKSVVPNKDHNEDVVHVSGPKNGLFFLASLQTNGGKISCSK